MAQNVFSLSRYYPYRTYLQTVWIKKRFFTIITHKLLDAIMTISMELEAKKNKIKNKRLRPLLHKMRMRQTHYLPIVVVCE